jgi:hypothetical protein
LAAVTAREQYHALQQELSDLEDRTGLFLCDEHIDRANVELPEGMSEFWPRMYMAACIAAGLRAEEMGEDINVLLGRRIY